MKQHDSSEIPIIEGAGMTFEEADHVLKESRDVVHPIDNIYPWWQTLRWPMLMLSAAFLILSVCIIFLSLTVKQVSGDGKTEEERDACYDDYTLQAAEASAEVRRAGSNLDSTGWFALVNSVTGQEQNEDEAINDITMLVEEVNKAVELEQQAIDERQDWIDEGRPLPCPLGG